MRRLPCPPLKLAGPYEHRSKGRIAKVKGTFDYHLRVQIILPSGEPTELAMILKHLAAYTELVLTYIEDTAQRHRDSSKDQT